MKTQNAKFLTIGNADSRRVQFWQNALSQENYSYELLSYEELCNNVFTKIKNPTTLRITSTGEDIELKKKILKIGGCPNVDDLLFQKGLIYPNRYWYRGWCVVLEKIEKFIQQNPMLHVMNTPAAIRLAFHKLNCQKLLQQKNISTPEIILEQVLDYDSLILKLQSENIRQVFIKPYHGSSASGVMAFRQANGKQILYTTIELKPDGKLFNNLRLQKYTSISKIKTIINSMIPSGLMVEEWIRKKKFRDKSVDLRILVVDGKASFVVPRMSHHFITNLHLGNEKGKIELLKNAWGEDLIKNAETLAVRAVEAIGGLFYAGVDVAISDKGVSYVLEVNAFGDMLLDIFDTALK